jgi:high-affinity iron transporter
MGEPTQVATLATSLANHLLAVYPVPLAPSAVPDVVAGAKLYAANCAACHGAAGHGDGPLAKQLDPKPIAFAEKDRARQRSVFALYQAVSQGIEGTAMPAFAQLSEQDRWAIATYLGTFSHDAAQVAEGEKLWAQGGKAKAEIPSLERFVRVTEAELVPALGEPQAQAVVAYLHAHPEALAKAQPAGLSLAMDQLKASVSAYEAGDVKKAQDVALSAYLDGVEPYEQALAARNADLKTASKAKWAGSGPCWQTMLRSNRCAQPPPRSSSALPKPTRRSHPLRPTPPRPSSAASPSCCAKASKPCWWWSP